MIATLLVASAISVSSVHPRYFETADGKPWIPIARNRFLGFPGKLIHCGKGTESLPAGYRLVDNENAPHLEGMR